MTTFEESPESAFERGKRAGEIDARLDGHDKHLAKINGSMDRFAIEMKNLTLAVQRLGDEAISRNASVDARDAARDATVVATAAALEKEAASRRDKATSKWTPLERLGGAIGALAALAVAIGTAYLAMKP